MTHHRNNDVPLPRVVAEFINEGLDDAKTPFCRRRVSDVNYELLPDHKSAKLISSKMAYYPQKRSSVCTTRTTRFAGYNDAAFNNLVLTLKGRTS